MPTWPYLNAIRAIVDADHPNIAPIIGKLTFCSSKRVTDVCLTSCHRTQTSDFSRAVVHAVFTRDRPLTWPAVPIH
jgi:hypothetical protein